LDNSARAANIKKPNKLNMISKTAFLLSRLATIAIQNPRRLSHVLISALVISNDVVDPTRNLLRIPVVKVNDLLPKDNPIEARFLLFPHSYASVSILESICLVLLFTQTAQRRIFEFGAYKGVSISELALNTGPQTEIFTLDLPENGTPDCLSELDPEDTEIAAEKNKGSMVPVELRPRIRFLKQDSAKFDPTPYEGQMDFAFVNGARDAKFVKKRHRKSLAHVGQQRNYCQARLLRPGPSRGSLSGGQLLPAKSNRSNQPRLCRKTVETVCGSPS
jgi:hypothetical protein